MAIYLFRGYNAAIPEVDVGDDIFVVRDEDGSLSRIQVKSAIAKGETTKRGRFHVPWDQLNEELAPDLHYVFAFHYQDLWRTFLVIPREILCDLHEDETIGRRDFVRNSVYFDIVLTETTTTCNGVSLHQFRDNWSEWPTIFH